MFNVGKRCVGSIFLEKVAPQEAEMGMMKALEKRPSVKVTHKNKKMLEHRNNAKNMRFLHCFLLWLGNICGPQPWTGLVLPI